MKQHYYFFLFSLVSFSLFAQSIETVASFDSIYNRLAREKTVQNLNIALKTADSLYGIAENNIQRIQSLIITAQILQQKGKKDEAIQKTLLAYNLANKIESFEWQSKILGQLSSLYRDAGVNEKGKQYLHKALEVSKKIINKDESNRFQGNAYQELSYYSKSDKNPKEAIEYLKKGITYFKKISDVPSKNFLIATNMELLGENFLLINQMDSAFFYYNKGLEYLNYTDAKQSSLKGFIHNGLGETYLKLGNTEKAIEYLTKAKALGEASDFSALKEKNYLALMKFYKATGDQDHYLTINEKYLELTSQLDNSKRNTADHLIKDLQEQEKKSKKNEVLFILTISFLVIVLFFSFFIYKEKRKKEYLKFQKILENISKNETTEKKPAPIYSLSPESVHIAPNTEERIYKELVAFEKNLLFLDEHISMSSLSLQLHTNTKYLSYVLKKYYNKDFCSYINQLKIKYILEKLKADKEYRKYKISYLASECGFSSHSKFTSVFKSVAGITPSEYLLYLNKNETLAL